ncbi:Site-specific DNA recombinase [Pseudooceanicola antarcticus]|uniref:Resolvase n=1 Tax=Pseudooceanicola antarcticus TaxID=1247613 RepID=A0A285JD92_9RHOB|nr:recombinase family protein [Pseudooceanicola antarcticus]PJE31344.1 resolvase [Pseudooceanicola antarcticus]SNY58205.1 Site-specific DNA recombinase [Pseudooceanicola antarcticus]
MKIVTYCRVSTRSQGQSGLGLEAQQAAIGNFAAANAAQIVGAFTEVESGRKADRPQLQAALKLAKLTSSKLVIAKLDRLSRNAAFLLNLQDSGVDFIACDNPSATPLTVGILAIVAQDEARAISERTKAALAAAKARGQRLGNPNGAEALRRAGKGNKASRLTASANADNRAQDLAETLAEVQAKGITTLAGIAKELNRRGINTARGKSWHPSSVANLRARLAA